jgi:CHAT domain-containing protein
LITLESGVLRKTVARDAAGLASDVRQLRISLETRTTREYLPHAQRMYDVLIRPWVGDLAPHGVTTLVFVPDGPLRTIPMAALHDGEKFLIERYAVAVTPGLQLTDPRPLAREQPQVLLAGVSKGIRDLPPLPAVPGELEGIQSKVGGDLLLDEAFTEARVKQEFTERDFNIVHVASHASFGAESSDSVVEAYDKAVTFDDFGKLVGFKRFSEQPIELLALSACETAQGSDRAALGLAGLAVKAGARSALGTLWSVNDESTSEVMRHFYEALGSPGISKAEALRSAQRSLLVDRVHRHPYYWSPFLLINNWL